jgi:hypothetical protein
MAINARPFHSWPFSFPVVVSIGERLDEKKKDRLTTNSQSLLLSFHNDEAEAPRTTIFSEIDFGSFDSLGVAPYQVLEVLPFTPIR